MDCFTFTTEEELTVLIVNCSGVVTLGLYRGTSLWRGKVISARADETSCWVIGTLSVGKYKLRVNAHDGEQRLYLREGHYPLTVVPGREISLPQTEPPNSQ